MVLTRSMATTNNVQEDEPWPTALERQVQTLTVAIECLTKQNQILEEQLRRKIGHDISGEDLEDTSAERRDWERLEGSNAPSRLERQNVSLPSLTDITPPPIVAEIQAIKEQMKVMINASRDECPAMLTILLTVLTPHSLPPSTLSRCCTSFTCRR